MTGMPAASTRPAGPALVTLNERSVLDRGVIRGMDSFDPSGFELGEVQAEVRP